MDCKDYKSPVDVKDVEQFIALVDDVSANKGVMVSANGFTSSAKIRARDAGLDLYRLVDAENHDWQAYVSIPVLCKITSIKAFNYIIKGKGDFKLAPQDLRMMMVYDEDQNPIDVTLNRIHKLWNEGIIPHDPGRHENISLYSGRIFIKTDVKFYELELASDVKVTCNQYFGQLPLSRVSGFKDELSGALITKEFETSDIDFSEVQQNWKKIETVDELAVKPVFTINTSPEYSLISTN